MKQVGESPSHTHRPCLFLYLSVIIYSGPELTKTTIQRQTPGAVAGPTTCGGFNGPRRSHSQTELYLSPVAFFKVTLHYDHIPMTSLGVDSFLTHEQTPVSIHGGENVADGVRLKNEWQPVGRKVICVKRLSLHSLRLDEQKHHGLSCGITLQCNRRANEINVAFVYVSPQISLLGRGGG